MNEALNYLSELLKLNDKIVVGVSGGPDSITLLNILVSLKSKYNLELICAHINHNVRENSKSEEEFVKNFCVNHGVIFESMTIDSYGDDNFHNEARKIRYVFFEELIKKYDAKYLMTAHHADDLIETILMRLTRGATFRGYAGFDIKVKKDNYEIIRPLIKVSREEIEEYIKTNSLEFCTDDSNLEDHYTRNRFRHHVLPFLKEENSSVHKKFLKFHDTLTLYDEYFSRIINKNLIKMFKDNKLDLEQFNELEELIQIKIIEEIFYILYDKDLYLINDEHVKLLFSLIISEKVNTNISLPRNIKAVKAYSTVFFEKEMPEISSYKVILEQETKLWNLGIIAIVDDSESTDNFVTRLLSSDISLPLYVRTRKDGDKMAVKNMNGHKKINDIFINQKISKKERDEWPVVVDSNDTIIWLPGLKKSKFDKEKSEKYDIILRYLKKGEEK